MPLLPADEPRSKPTRGSLMNERAGQGSPRGRRAPGAAFALPFCIYFPRAEDAARGHSCSSAAGANAVIYNAPDVTGFEAQQRPPRLRGSAWATRPPPASVTAPSPGTAPASHPPFIILFPSRGEMVPLRQLNSCQRGGIFACVADAENTSQRYFK